MALNRVISASVIIAILTLAAFRWLSVETNPDDPTQSQKNTSVVHQSAPTVPIDAENAAVSDKADRSNLIESLNCIGSDGFATCGEFTALPMLSYLAEMGEHDSLRQMAENKENLAKHGQGALNHAIMKGDLQSVQILIDAGDAFGFFRKDRLGQHPLFSENYSPGPGDPKYKVGEHPALMAVQFDQVEILAFFVDNGFDINTPVDSEHIDALGFALLSDNQEIVDWLFDHNFTINCNFQFPNGRSYLDVAKGRNMPGVVERILEHCPKK